MRKLLGLTLAVAGLAASVPDARAAFGDPDPTFGDGGSVTFARPSGYQNVLPMTIEAGPAGVVMGGIAYENYDGVETVGRPYVAKILPDGRLDPEFNGGQPLVLTVPGKGSRVFAMDLDASGRVLLAISLASDAFFGDDRLALVRLLPDGRPDPSFGPAGSPVPGGLVDPVPDGYSEVEPADVAVQADGRIVVAATARGGPNGSDMAALRFAADGSARDPSLDGDGLAIVDIGRGASATKVLLRADGRLVLGGSFQFLGTRCALVQLTAGGALDPAFRGVGWSGGYSGAAVTAATELPGGQLAVLSSDGGWPAFQRVNPDSTAVGATSPEVFRDGTGWTAYAVSSTGRGVLSGWTGTNTLVLGALDVNGQPSVGLNPASPGMRRYPTPGYSFAQIFAMTTAPDGAVLLATAVGNEVPGGNGRVDASLRITRLARDNPPTAALARAAATAGVPVTLDASASTDPDGPLVRYEWDLDGDGAFERDGGAARTLSHTFPTAGRVTAAVRVTDEHGSTAGASTTVDVATAGAGGGGGGGSGATPTPLRLTGLRLKAAKLRYRLNRAARLSAVVTRKVPGHRRGGRCRPGAGTGKRCTAVRTLRKQTAQGKTGVNVLRLRISGLAPGRYTLVLRATDAGGVRSKTVKLSFRVRRPG